MFFGNLSSSIKDIKGPYVFVWEHELLCIQCRGIGPHLLLSGKSHGFSRVASRTWDIFTINCGDAHLKLVCVQQRQDCCLVKMDTLGI